ncbi:hypothetical protein S7335_5286 [Synechococcus sp. PCC 7335]|uniref:hypothetical protein n=1 Tax=Synechococcus sp. (strain ATCC 29403 / PCC 7335) TaxID=91464 RepID=UPI00017EC3F1|nr:hypothetical protein [Synechococcus sp. PCC 7335]EDX87576.1 hypothetical protein S7335_5286 [Synechococcus sp. PCC 7335]
MFKTSHLPMSRSAIESVIAHGKREHALNVKRDHALKRNYLLGKQDDCINSRLS